MKKITNWIYRNPISSVLMILAIVITVSGFYVASPFFIPTASPVGSAFTQRTFQIITGLIYAGSGLWTLWGLYKQKIKTVANGAFAMCLVYVFSGLLRGLTVAWLPPTFLAILGLGLISGVCYIRLRVNSE